MKKTILAVALLVAGLAFADKEKSKEEFYEAL